MERKPPNIDFQKSRPEATEEKETPPKMPTLFNFEFTVEHEEMTGDEKRKAEDKIETVFNEIFGDEWIGCYDWDYNPKYDE